MHLARKTSLSLFFAALAALCAVELWVASSPAFLLNLDTFALVVTADLLLGIPLLFYGLVARPYRLSPATVAPIFLLAAVIAGYILPPAGRGYLDMVALLLPLAEVVILGATLWKARGFYQHYQRSRREQIYMLDALETSARAVFGSSPAVKLIATELTLIVLAIFGWFMNFRSVDPRQRTFSYHRKSLYPALFLVFLVLIVLETAGLHLLIQRWSPLAAWILTGLSIYSALWLVGDFHAIRLHPIVLAGDMLHLRCGLRWSVALPVADIIAVQAPRRADAKAPGYLSFALTGEPQIVLVLKQPVRVEGLFGMQKEAARIGVFLDDLGAFRAELDQRRLVLFQASC